MECYDRAMPSMYCPQCGRELSLDSGDVRFCRYCGFLLYFGQQEITAGRMNAAQFLTFLFFLFRSYDPMRKLSRLQNNMEQALAAAHHVWEIMDEHKQLPEKPQAVELKPLAVAIELNPPRCGP